MKVRYENKEGPREQPQEGLRSGDAPRDIPFSLCPAGSTSEPGRSDRQGFCGQGTWLGSLHVRTGVGATRDGSRRPGSRLQSRSDVPARSDAVSNDDGSSEARGGKFIEPTGDNQAIGNVSCSVLPAPGSIELPKVDRPSSVATSSS